jgi:hypothetical protein
MRSGPLRNILLALSLERADREGAVVPAAERLDATREAARTLSTTSGAAEQFRFFADRAALLLDRIAARIPAMASAFEPPHRWRFVSPLVLVAAILTGWFSQALGPEKLINILSFPLLGILLWNFAVYLIEAVSVATGLHRRSDPVSSEREQGWIGKWGEWIDGRGMPNDLPAPARQGLGDFAKRWRLVHGPVTRARARGVLHLGAALLAAAALAGMYAKGIANEYRAYWESTFLTPESLRGILGVVLGPASAVSGIAIPDAESLESLRRTPDGAARWIHLHAITVALFVIGPRFLLAAWQAFSARRMEQAIDVRSVAGAGLYFDRLLADALGTALPVRAIGYCHRLSPTAEGALRRHLEEVTGAPVRLDWAESVPLGGEDAFFLSFRENPGAAAGHMAVVFDLAATPEVETHGDFLRRLRDMLAETAPETRLQVCLDAEGFFQARRHLADCAERLQDRLAAWKSVAGPLKDDLSVFPAEN